MEVVIAMLMADLIVKDDLSMVLLMHICFGTPSIRYHDDLFGPLGLLFVNIHRGYENVGKMVGNHYFDVYDVDGYSF